MPPRPPPNLLPTIRPSSATLCARPSTLLPTALPLSTWRRTLSSSSPAIPHSSPANEAHHSSRIPPPPPQRWVSDLRARVGRCVTFGCNAAQIRRAAGVVRVLAEEWRPLTAGSEGFLSGGRRGLEGQKVVWGEQDSFGHVNNVNYFRYAESARVNWITNFAVHADPAHRKQWSELMTPTSIGLIMRTLKSEFKFPMTYPDRISVYHRLRHDPSSSSSSSPSSPEPPSAFTLDCIVLSHNAQRIAARLEEDIVIYDYRKAGKTAMPGYMVDIFGETYKMQEAEMRRARARIWELIGRVEELERGTWDREGAVEDLGGKESEQ
ncbi:thioesterase-like superfamily-domain-containing protein [Coniochaeta sp. 2T2.1]|nr:thioesterase-like superfamily-domain-containing protein [Coniochaeta sp. 2T2.1]